MDLQQDGNYRFGQDMMQRVGEMSTIGRIFMSSTNVDALQDAIRYRVYVESGNDYIIGRQSDAELGIIMRSIILQHGRNDETEASPLPQVRELNRLVLEFCVPRIVREIDGWMQYRRDASQTYIPMRMGDAVSNKATGSRSLEARDFI
jgi:hypothetical protein